MDSADVIASKKQVKDHKNLCMRSNKKMLSMQEEDESFRRLRNLFLKTEEMKEVSAAKNKEMESQFKELQERLANSSGFLNQIKSSIENIKFSYQKDIMDLEKVTGENREEIDRQIEELKMNIGKLQSIPKEEKPKPQTYQEALTEVLTSLQNIAQEKYSSRNVE